VWREGRKEASKEERWKEEGGRREEGGKGAQMKDDGWVEEEGM
jgi:hypothetical protein